MNERRVGNKQIPNPKQQRLHRQMCAWRLIKKIPVYLWLASRKSFAHTCLWYRTQNSQKSEHYTDAVDQRGKQEMCQKRKTVITRGRGENGDDYPCWSWFEKTSDKGMNRRYDIICCSSDTKADREEEWRVEHYSTVWGVMTFVKKELDVGKKKNGLQHPQFNCWGNSVWICLN